MAIELARAQALPKPWGVADLGPWSKAGADDGRLLGEIWYERPRGGATDPSLLLKLLFTSQPLSIQVHPDDAYAQSIGLPCGKSEAWYILSAAPGAKVALGLKERLTPRQLREAIDNGSIVRHIAWRSVLVGDVVSVPAGAIHAIGAGLVIVEIQQRSDATFRMFDFGRKRELHLASAIAVADAGPVEVGPKPKRLTDERTLLVSNPHFTFERIELAPGSAFSLEAERETWLVVISGSVRAGKFGVAMGDAIFAQADSVDLQAGPDGMVGLVAIAGVSGSAARRRVKRNASDAGEEPGEVQALDALTRTKAAPARGHAGTMQ